METLLEQHHFAGFAGIADGQAVEIYAGGDDLARPGGDDGGGL